MVVQGSAANKKRKAKALSGLGLGTERLSAYVMVSETNPSRPCQVLARSVSCAKRRALVLDAVRMLVNLYGIVYTEIILQL